MIRSGAQIAPSSARAALGALVFGCLAAAPATAEVGKAFIAQRDRDTEIVLEEVDEALRAGRVDDGVSRLQLLHERTLGMNSVVRLPGRATRQRTISVGASDRIIETLRALPPEGIAAYRRQFDERAASVRKRAEERANLEELERAVLLYPVATETPMAALGAAELFLERAEVERAREMLDFAAWDDLATDAARRRLAYAWMLLAGRTGDTLLYRAWAAELATLHPAAGPERPAPPAPATAGARGALPKLPFLRGEHAWHSNEQRERGGHSGYAGAPYTPVPFAPTDAWIAVAGGSGLDRYDLAGGRLLQSHEFPLAAPSDRWERRDRFHERDRLARIYTTGNERLLVTSYVASAERSTQYFGHKITEALARRALRAVRVLEPGAGGARGAGKVWDSAESGDSWLREVSFNSEPLVWGDRLLALGWRSSGYVQCYLVCLDLATGRRLYSTLLAANQIELTMFGEFLREPFLGSLLLEGGSLYACTNLGVVAALRPWDGGFRWLTEYDALPTLFGSYNRVPARTFKWSRNPLIRSGDRLFATPLDSDECLALDRKTGEILEHAALGDEHEMYLLGLHEERLVFCGGESLLLVPAGDIAKQDGYSPLGLGGKPIEAPPALVEGGILFSVEDGIWFQEFAPGRPARRVVPETELSPAPGTGTRKRHAAPARTGTVMVLGKHILLASSSRVACFRERREDPEAPAEPVEPAEPAETSPR